MKKGKLLNSTLSAVVAKMGHKQQLIISDAGLPIMLRCRQCATITTSTVLQCRQPRECRAWRISIGAVRSTSQSQTQ
jgi:hypothetical protein